MNNNGGCNNPPIILKIKYKRKIYKNNTSCINKLTQKTSSHDWATTATE
jgi:hypothetical protein